MFPPTFGPFLKTFSRFSRPSQRPFPCTSQGPTFWATRYPTMHLSQRQQWPWRRLSTSQHKEARADAPLTPPPPPLPCLTRARSCRRGLLRSVFLTRALLKITGDNRRGIGTAQYQPTRKHSLWEHGSGLWDPLIKPTSVTR